METLHFLKFWKPNNASTIAVPSPLVETDNEVEEEEEDSFFDLELSFDIMNKNDANKACTDDATPQESNRLDSIPKSNNSAKKAGCTEPCLSKPPLSLSPSDPISKRKILPIEPIFKPQSPISLLKSAPKFGAFMLKTPKATKTTAKKTEKTREAESKVLMETQKQKTKEGNLFGVKLLNTEEHQNPSKLTRENSSRRKGSRQQNQSSEDSKTERFSKDMIQKYLNLIKPLYMKVSKKCSEKVKPSGNIPMSSPNCSPAVPVLSMCSPKKDKQGNIPAGIRVVCKNLGKSKSATTMAVAPQVKRRDDSLLLQHDGIQSAILHCKRSFNSRDSSSLSRSASDSSSMNSYSTDCSLLSRFASESHDKSARSSIEEGVCAEI
ncbi:probable membrane-associated kinase regulator 5 [Prunus avium]|uniref:Probable membrane-associated kinase regulator 5 n=1 Tax=Prunus avium TaxID=42229 RepID=A0A6P5THJ9_PRUAV|nr:probable membrane-associated kinase regulator 5 [Prunus avium]